jgi:hypothetical protein
VHAGWRGAVAGIVESTVATMVALGAERADLVAAVGPCIRQSSYEVDGAVREAVLAVSPTAVRFFAPGVRAARWQFDLAEYVVALLRAERAFRIDDLGLDTLQDDTIYFSHRRSRQRDEVGYGLQLSGIRVPG